MVRSLRGPCVLDAEIGRHAASAVHPALEGDRFQIAPQIVAPGVIDALEILGAAAGIVEADQRAAMDAAVLERGDRTVGVAHDHDRHLSDLRRAPVAGVGDFGFQAEKIPDRAFEDPLLFGLQQLPVAIDPVRNPRQVAGPGRMRRRLEFRRIETWHGIPSDDCAARPHYRLSRAGILTSVARGSQAL